MEKFLKYLDNNNYSKNTIYCYRYVLKDLFNQLDDRSLTFYRISKYLKLQQEKYKPSTVQFKKDVILSYLKFSNSKLYKEVEEIKIPSSQNTFFQTIDEELFKKIISKIRIKENKDLFKIFYYCGIRMSELKTIKYNKSKNSIIVYGKGMKYREIPLVGKLKDIDFSLYQTYSKKKIYSLIKKYWPEWVTPHTFRRSFCTNLIRNGANIKIVSLVMGHSRIETTARYMHFTSNDVFQELEKYLK
ncbi:tyrosine-type recombinase/integrase [Mesoplasma lactucae]|uniref:Uncharacterized protein n=1 Tax=Mesoplasma lactucae ATCC 49193 TaxID=81460 RepID=A0A291ISU3_9MOLU|nr:site-specific integrase [Mesoplasma lactucae]ATG97798.1 hypothetical protein CP520_03620 [Mesoplasma lactucae ATCC 49193]ATZ20423.1 integrase [Mesoplasma lactucae ATCC 49193]MCL8216595.1 Tyrosine recombinase XerD [Mesoplasma lactucae ATCC 49193]